MTEYSDAEVFGGVPPAPPGGPPSSSGGGYSDAEVFGGRVSPSATPGTYDDSQVFGQQSTPLTQYPVEAAKGLVQGGKDLFASALKGYGASQADFNRRTLEYMDRVDAGAGLTPPKTMMARARTGQTELPFDPYGYQQMTPEQRIEFRKQMLPTLTAPVEKQGLFEAGQGLEDFGKQTLKPGPGFENSWTRDLSSATGSMLGGLGLAMVPGVGPPTAGMTFLGAGMGQQYDDAVQSGATPEQRLRATRIGSVAGATDLVDISIPMLGTAGRVLGLIRRVGLRALEGALVEGGQEGLQQYIQNLIAKDIYDPKRDPMKDVPYNAVIGAIVGGHTAAALGGHGGHGTAPTQQQIDNAAQPPTQPPTAPVVPTPPGVPPASVQTPPLTPTAAPGVATPTTTDQPSENRLANYNIDPFIDPNVALMGPEPPPITSIPIEPAEPPTPPTTTQVAATQMDPDAVKFIQDEGTKFSVPESGSIPSLDDLLSPSQKQAASPLREEITAEPGIDISGVAGLFSAGLYGKPQDSAAITLKEMFQNSFDGIKGAIEKMGLKRGRVDVTMDPVTRTITLTDNGTGMHPQTLGKEFLQIAGTKKESNRPSGGFGVAKMMFLYSSAKLDVVTMRDGVVAELHTTGPKLYDALEKKKGSIKVQIRGRGTSSPLTNADYRMFPEGHGVRISSQVPQTYVDSNTGKTEAIDFQPYISEYTNPVMWRSPLLEPIDVTFNGEKLPIGSGFDASKYTQFANVKFNWGSAQIYVSQEPPKGYRSNNADVLSNGLWQFSLAIPKDPLKPFSEMLPQHFYINVQPEVAGNKPGYPFGQNRQQFSASTKDDFQKIFNYISLVYQAADFKDSVDNFGDMQYLTYQRGSTTVGISPKIKIQPKSPPPATAVSLIKPGDTVNVVDGRLVVNGRTVPELTTKDMEKFRIDPQGLTVDQSEIKADQVMVHDNMEVKLGGAGAPWRSLTDYARERFGGRFDEYIFALGNAFKELRNIVATFEIPAEEAGKMTNERAKDYKSLLKTGVGVSFDNNYRGVSIKVPFEAQFINPVLPVYTDPVRASLGMIGTMIHELAHHHHRSEEGLAPPMQLILALLDADQHFNFTAYKQKVINIVARYEDVFKHLNSVFTSGDFDIRPRGKRFSEPGAIEAGNGGALGDVAGDGSTAGGASALSGWVDRSEAFTQSIEGRTGATLETGPSRGTGDPDPVASRVANQRALDSEVRGTRATSQQPELLPLRQAVSNAFGGAVPPTAAPSLSHADRMNKFYKYMAGIDQLADANPHFIPLLRYYETTRIAHNDESKIQDAALRISKEWRSLGAQGENLTALINDVANMSYLTSAERAAGVQRHPTGAEFSALVQKHKVEAEALQVYNKIKFLFDGFLTLVQQNSVATANRMISDPVRLAAKLDEINTLTDKLRSVPYFPFMNFGRHYVTVKDASGTTVHFETFERRGFRSAERQQQAAVKELQNKFGATAIVQHGILPESAAPFIGMPTSMLADIKNDPDIGLSDVQKQALDMLVFMRTSAGSFATRFKQKNYIPGYSMDFKRAFASYFFHGARFYSRAKYSWSLRDNVAQARAVHSNKENLIADYMDDHLHNVILDYTGDFGALKGAIFLWALGYVPAAATQNLTQTPMITFPFLGAKFGDLRASREIISAATRISSYYRRGKLDTMTDFEYKALAYGIRTGRITETQAPQLAGLAQGANLLAGIGGNRAQRSWVQVMEKSAWMFEMAEQVNRRIAYRAALRLAMQNPNAKFVKESVAKFADEFDQLKAEYGEAGAKAVVTAAHTVDQTQYVYARYARPRFMRGRAASTLFVFKKYMQATLFMLGHNKSDVLPRYLIVAAAMGGLAGLPGYDDLRDILRALGEWLFGKHFNLDHEIREYVNQFTNGKVEPDLVLHGLARRGYGLPGLIDMIGERPGRGLSYKPAQNIPFPILDRSKAVSIGNVLPFEVGKLFTPAKDQDQVIADQTQKASGAVWSVGFNLYKALMDEKNQASDWKRWERAMPRALSSASRSYRAFTESRERGRGGPQSAPTIINYDPRDTEQMMEALALAGGYQPLRLSEKWDSILAKTEVEKFYDLQRDGLLQQLFEATRAKVPGELEDVKGQIQKFNRELPEWAKGRAITADTALKSIQGRAQEVIRREAGVPSQKTNVGISRHIDTLFPGATVDVRRVR